MEECLSSGVQTAGLARLNCVKQMPAATETRRQGDDINQGYTVRW